MVLKSIANIVSLQRHILKIQVQQRIFYSNGLIICIYTQLPNYVIGGFTKANF